MVTQIGPYQIINSLGKGGMGEVFLAYDPRSSHYVALKRIRSDLPPQTKEFLLNEISLMRGLCHPAILPIHSIGENQEGLYYIMPYIEGESLDRILGKEREEKVKKLDIKSIFTQICQALTYAHAQGVLHRDLKPSNILIEKTGKVWIGDWGMGIRLEEIDLGQAKSIPGTVAYFSPELVQGHPPTPQSDIYALGLVLYEMLTLRHPFHRGNMQEYYQNIQNETLPDPAKIAPERDMPPLLSYIALKALAYEPQARYQSVAQILADLESPPHITKTIEKIVSSEASKPLYFTDWLEQEEYSAKYQQIQSAFLRGDSQTIENVWAAEMQSKPAISILESTLIALVELGLYELAEQKLKEASLLFLDVQAIVRLSWIKAAIHIHTSEKMQIAFLHELPKNLSIKHLKPLYHILQEALRRQEADLVISTIKVLFNEHSLTLNHQQKLVFLLVQAFLMTQQWEEVEKSILWLKRVNS